MEEFLNRSNERKIGIETRLKLQKIMTKFNAYATHVISTRRCKLRVGTDKLQFKKIAQVDTMFIKSKPVVHMVDLSP